MTKYHEVIAINDFFLVFDKIFTPLPYFRLGGRATTQGLVAVRSTGSIAAVVELSCETDFVARGENFKKLLEQLVEAVLNYAQKHTPEISSNKIHSVDLVSQLQSLVDAAGKPIPELVAMAVGKLGENIAVRSVRALYAPSNSSLYSAAHPKEGNASVSMGKFVSVVALKRPELEGLFPTDKLAAQLCQHVIGMRSETLGEPPVEQKSEEKKAKMEENRDELNDFEEVQTTTIDEEETALLRQSFMLNPSQTVYEYVKGHQAEIVDFIRSELGEAADS